MIPKVIHFCWFGNNPKPEIVYNCIDSWKKYLPDYKIIEWNENNFDIKLNNYCKQAYENRKWAFVSDYVRLYVLFFYGGIYLDSDVEVLRPLDEFLKLSGFSGFETSDFVPTGIMASEKGNQFIELLLKDYDDRDFVLSDGTLDLTTNVIRITQIAEQNGLKKNNSLQRILDFDFYPSDYFCPKSHEDGEIRLTNNSYTIHHFSGSWLETDVRLYRQEYYRLRKKYGVIIAKIISPFSYNIKSGGIKKLIKNIIKRVFNY